MPVWIRHQLERIEGATLPVWKMLVHVANHGMQHRAEASALLTGESRSPGELDLIDDAEERAGAARSGTG